MPRWVDCELVAGETARPAFAAASSQDATDGDYEVFFCQQKVAQISLREDNW